MIDRPLITPRDIAQLLDDQTSERRRRAIVLTLFGRIARAIEELTSEGHVRSQDSNRARSIGGTDGLLPKEEA